VIAEEGFSVNPATSVVVVSGFTLTARDINPADVDYFIRGSITQLGTSITLTIICRDIKTLDVVSSEQRQYTTENVWDNSDGIPVSITLVSVKVKPGVIFVCSLMLTVLSMVCTTIGVNDLQTFILACLGAIMCMSIMVAISLKTTF
jgi:hypothetical protein